jgi:ribose 5-phosphate isomerase B
MRIAIGSDHAGFALKQSLLQHLRTKVKVKDFGVFAEKRADYPDIAFKVAKAISRGEFDRGILICGTGIGMSIAANKVGGVRAACCNDVYLAKMSRRHNDANVLCLGGRVIGGGLAWEIVSVWLAEEFEGKRHKRRVEKIIAKEERRDK